MTVRSGADLPEPFSREEGTIHFKGRPVKGVEIDGASFEVLGPVHARDAAQVFLVMATKLKVIKRADAGSFESLGDAYGRDASSVFFREKPVRLKQGAGTVGAFRELDPYYGTDGVWLYFGNEHVEPPRDVASGKVKFDWAAARYLPFEENPINRSDAVFSDGKRSYLWTWGGDWKDLGKVRLDDLRKLGDDLAGVYSSSFVSDGKTVWFRGDAVRGIDAGQARQLGQATVEDGKAVYCGDVRLGYRPGELKWVDASLYRTQGTLVELGILDDKGSLGDVRAEVPGRPLDVATAFQSLVAVLLAPAFSLFDRHLPLETILHDVDFDVAPPRGVPEVAAAALPDGRVELSAGAASASGLPSAWLSILSSLWSQLRGRSDGFLVYVNHGTMLPDADDAQGALARRAPVELMDLCAALHAAGDLEEAQSVLHLFWVRAEPTRFRRASLDDLYDAIARIPFELVDRVRYKSIRHRLEVTTNLAVAKLLAADGLFTHEDFRVRWEAANLLNGVLSASSKTKQILKPVLRPLLERVAKEPVGVVREAYLAALDTAAVSVTVAAEGARQFEYGSLEEIARALIAAGANVNMNRVRLAEALFGQGRDDDAEALMLELQAEDGDDPWPTPGAYSHRKGFPSLEAAARASRERARQAPRFQV